MLAEEVAIPRNLMLTEVRSHFGREMPGEHETENLGTVVRAVEVDEAHSICSKHTALRLGNCTPPFESTKVLCY